MENKQLFIRPEFAGRGEKFVNIMLFFFLHR